MADEKEKVETTKVTLKHGGRGGQRIIIDVHGAQHVIGPGVEREVELAAPEAERMKKVAEDGGGDLIVGGVNPAEKRAELNKNEAAPETPDEHGTRAAVAKKEQELMHAGQEADAEGREKRAKMSAPDLAAQSGIGILARGADALETVASPPDAPPVEESKSSSSSARSTS